MHTKRYLNSLWVLLVIVVLGACNTSIPSPAKRTENEVETMNAALETLAKHFAQAVTTVKVRQQIQQGVSTRFDGDTNVLYETLISGQAQNPLRQALAGAYLQRELSSQSETQSSAALDQLATNIPHLQVAVPTLFDAWDAEHYTPLVGYVPVGVDDNAITSIRAFDAEGNVHLLDAHALPDKPVILLSQNERTDETGELRPEFIPVPEDSPPPSSPPACSRFSHTVYIRGVLLVDDFEPWYLGDPEIMLETYSTETYSTEPGFYYHGEFAEVDNVNQFYYPDRFLGCTPSGTMFSWYEDDGFPGSEDWYGDILVFTWVSWPYVTWHSTPSNYLDFAIN